MMFLVQTRLMKELKMLVVTTIRLSKGFQAWRDMVHSVGDKIQEHGMTLSLLEPKRMTTASCTQSFTLKVKRISRVSAKMRN